MKSRLVTLIFILLLGSIMVLTACQSDNDNNENVNEPTNNEENDDNNLKDEDNNNENTNNNQENNNSDKEGSNNNDSNSNENHSSNYLTSLDEYIILAEYLDLENLTADIVEDHKSSRVIIYRNQDGQKQYKSVFTKHEEYLEINDFDGGVIFRGPLKLSINDESNNTSSNNNNK